MITQEQKEILLFKVDAEGFDYCFMDYSDWKEIKDTKFHQLRKDYVKAAKALKKLIDSFEGED